METPSAAGIGPTLRLLRELRNLSQDIIAEKAGVSQQTVSRWETGESSPTYEQLSRTADALGTSVDSIEQLSLGRAFVQLNTDNSNHNGYQIFTNNVQHDDLIQVYERLLAGKDARIGDLQRQIESLQKGRRKAPENTGYGR